MELELQKEQIKTNRKIYSGRTEHIETTEIIVPDYLPDVSAVTASQAQINIKDKSAADDRVTVNGEICFTALFAAQGGGAPVSVSGRAPFREIFAVPGAAAETTVCVNVSLGQCEARAVNSRKIGFRAVAEIDVGAYEPQVIDVVTGFSSDIHIETLKISRELLLFGAYGEKEINLEEDLHLPASKPDASQLLTYRARLLSDSVKLISNKAVIKGAAKLVCLYLPEGDGAEPETFESVIPFSLIADIPGVTESDEADVSFEVSDVSTSLSNDSSGRTFAVSITACVRVCAYRRTRLESITDAFSTTHDLELKKDETAVYSLFEKKAAPVNIRDVISPPEGMTIQRVPDIYYELSAFDSSLKAGEIRLSASADVRALCIGGDGSIFCAQKTLPVNISVAAPEEKKPEAYAAAPSLELSFNLNMSGELEIRLSGDVWVSVFENAPFSCPVKAGAEIKPEGEGELPALYAYFPDRRETVWDIAKRYGAAPEDIIGANNLTAGVQSAPDAGHMLLIPRMRLSGK